jgi:hypothetical protein
MELACLPPPDQQNLSSPKRLCEYRFVQNMADLRASLIHPDCFLQNASGHLDLPNPAISSRNLLEQALFGDLCTKMSPMDHRRAGWPVASLVDFATDTEGTPIFSLSPMAMHTRNMKYDPRCSLVVEMPGWRGLARCECPPSRPNRTRATHPNSHRARSPTNRRRACYPSCTLNTAVRWRASFSGQSLRSLPSIKPLSLSSVSLFRSLYW